MADQDRMDVIDIEDMEPELISLRVMVNGVAKHIEMRAFSLYEWFETVSLVSDPIPPKKLDDNGTKVDNLEDEEYRRELAMTEHRRYALLIIRALQATGNYLSLAKLPPAKQIEQFLQVVDFGMYWDLRTLLLSHRSRHFARLEERAESFQSSGETTGENPAAVSLDTETVADNANGR